MDSENNTRHNFCVFNILLFDRDRKKEEVRLRKLLVIRYDLSTIVHHITPEFLQETFINMCQTKFKYDYNNKLNIR